MILPVYVQDMRRVKTTQRAHQKSHRRTIMRHKLGNDFLDAATTALARALHVISGIRLPSEV